MFMHESSLSAGESSLQAPRASFAGTFESYRRPEDTKNVTGDRSKNTQEQIKN